MEQEIILLREISQAEKANAACFLSDAQTRPKGKSRHEHKWVNNCRGEQRR
jgi:hypothetical protein